MSDAQQCFLDALRSRQTRVLNDKSAFCEFFSMSAYLGSANVEDTETLFTAGDRLRASFGERRSTFTSIYNEIMDAKVRFSPSFISAVECQCFQQ